MLAQNMYIHHLAALFVIYTQVHHHNQSSEQEIQRVIRSLLEEYIQAQSDKRLPMWEIEPVSTKLPTLIQQFAKSYRISQIGVALHKYLLALQAAGRLPATIKNYRSDIGQYLGFASSNSPDQIVQKTEVAQFIEYEQTRGSSNSTIQRKLASMGQFFQWLQENGWLTTNQWKSFSAHEFTELLKDAKSVRELTTPVSQVDERPAVWSLPLKNIDVQQYLPKHFANSPIKKIKKAPFFSRIKQAMGAQPLLGYFNLAMGVLFLIGTTFLGYQQFFSGADSSQAFPANLTRPNRSLSFQGRLTSATRTPITSITPMRFRLYDSGPATGSGNLLWDSTSCNIDPDQDGIFSTTLGDACGTEITSDVFTEHSNVWLEVQVNSEILNPRQSIKTVAYALNSETLQGYPASASAVESTVVVMRSDGKVVFGNANPILEATGDSFAITAKTLTLETSSGSNGNVIINPDGIGQTIINSNSLIEGYLSAPSATLSATYAGGTALTLKAGPSATGDIMQWQTSVGTPLGVIDKSGNIGIGTTVARASLEIAGTASSSGTLTFKGTTDPKIDILNGESFGIRTSVGGDAGLTEALTVLSGGNVGIGTTGPGSKLEVGGRITLSNTSAQNDWLGNWDTAIQLNASGDLISWGTGTRAAIGASTDRTLHFKYDNGSSVIETLTVDTSGNLVNTGYIDATSYVSGSSLRSDQHIYAGYTGPDGNKVLYFYDGGVATGQYLMWNDTAGRFDLSSGLNVNTIRDLSGNNLILQDDSGNVGIGTTAPGQKLDVAGDAEIANYLYFANGATNYLRFDGSDFLLSNDFLPSADSTYDLGASGTAWAEIHGDAIYQNGNVVCDASGNCSGVGNFWQYTNGGISPSGAYNSVADFYIGGTATASAKFAFLNVNSGTPTATIAGNLALAVPTGATPATHLNIYNGGTLGVQTSVGGDAGLTERLTILNNGNVGIGSATPTQALDVVGGGYFSTGISAGHTTVTTGVVNANTGFRVANAATTGNVLRGNGTNFVSATLAGSDITGAALTKVDDTNVTATLGGTPTTALLRAASITLGWTGQLAIARGGTNGTATPTAGGVSYGTGTAYAFTTAGTSGMALISGGAGAPSFGTLGLTYGGTNADLSAAATGGLIYKGASALAATGALTGVLKGNGASAPTAMTGTSNYVTYWSDANTIAATQYLNLSQGGTNKVMTASAGSIAYSDADSLEFSSVGTSGHLLTSGGTGAPTWTDPATLSAAANFWTINAGAIYPKNATTDLLVGGTATASAKFAFLNVNSGTPTASVSAGAAGASNLTATGILGTTNRQTLVLGSATTGNVAFAPAGSTAVTILQNGNVGIGSATPTQALDVVGGGYFSTGISAGHTTVTTGVVNANTGFRVANAATTGNVLRGNGTNFVSATLAGSDITGAALTKVDDTNVTATLGGTPTTALLRAASITLGWTGQLAIARGGTNGTASPTAGGVSYGTGTAYAFTTAGTSGMALISGGAGAPSFGTLGLTYGGTNANLSAAATGGLIYKGASALAATGALTGVLKGNGASAPTAMTGTSNYVTYWSDANTIAATQYLNLSQGGTNKVMTASAGSIAYSDADSLEFSSVGTSGHLLTSGGTGAPTWTDPATLSAAANFWTIATGAIYPKNSTLDMFVGGTATDSAKFAFLNVNSGTPTASVSAGAAGASNLTATGILGTTNRQTLVLGSATTGNVAFAPAGSTAVTILQNGNVGIGSATPTQKLDVVGGGYFSTGISAGHTTVTTGVVNANTGFRVANAATTGNVLRGNGTNFVSATLAGSDITGAALTKVDDTNVTATLGGTPTTALLRAASITLGWTGQLAIARGGTNGTASPTAGGVSYGTGTAYAFTTAGTSGMALISGGAGAPSFGTLGLTYGGTNANLSAAATGGLIYKGASALAATGALTGVLKGNGASAPTAMTGTSNYVTYWSDANTIAATQYLNLSQGGTNKVMTASAGSIAYSDADSLEFSSVGTSGHLLTSGGTGAPTWTDPAALSAAANFWTIATGAIYPKNSTLDMFVGGTATDSAKFAFLNVNSGTPTASVSAGAAGASNLTATGILGTTNRQTLVLGSATTGNVAFAPAGSTAVTILQNGNVGIGSATPTQALDVVGGGYFSTGISAGHTTVTTGVVNANTGFRVANAATTGNVLRGNGTNFVSATLAGSDITGAALTKVDDTNVTATLGGTPTTALLRAASITLGWTGQLAIARGGTNGTASPTAGGVSYGTGTAYAFTTAGTSGMALISGGAGAPSFGTLGLTYGGTNANLSAAATGGLIYKGASALAATGALTGVLKGNGASAPTAMTGTSNYVTYWSDANTIAATQYLNLSQGGTNKVMTASAGSIAYSDADSLEFSSVGTSGHLLTSGGTGAPTWTDPATLSAAANFWTIATGAIYPKNSTLDMFVGGTATDSAKFAFLNVNSGTPTASVSAGAAGASNLTATGILGTTNRQTLVLGSATTGNVAFAPAGSTAVTILQNGNVGIGSATPTQALDVVGGGYFSTGISAGHTTVTTGVVNANTGFRVANAATTGNVLRGNGTNFVSATLAGSDITGAALTKVDDTNVTATLGGTPTTALLRAASITLGWTGQLAIARGGTNGTASPTAGGVSYGTGTAYAFTTAGTSGMALISGGAGAPSFGTLGLTYGGTNANLSAAATGGLIYKGASALAATGALTGVLKGNGASAPTAMTGTSNYVTYWSDANTIAATQYLNLSQGGTNKVMTASAGSIAYSDADSLEFSSVGTSGHLLTSGGTGAPTWTDPAALSAAANFWTIATGAIYPKNSTLDMFVGGTATDSAKFAFLNVNSGTPTASVSAGAAGASNLTATGVLGTTNRQTLVLGSATTGNVAFAPAGSTAVTILQNGNVGIGTTEPRGILDAKPSTAKNIYLSSYPDYNFRLSGGNELSVVRDNGAAADMYLQYGINADIRMVLGSTGNVGIGGAVPAYKLDVVGTAGFSSTINAPSIGTGTDDSVVVLNTSGNLVTDEIDSRVWGTSLVDGAGTTNYNAYWSDANTLTAEQFVSVTRGGLGANVTAVGAGELLYSTATTTYDSLAAGTSGMTLLSGGAGAPTWGTLGLIYGGTNANLSAAATGGLIYKGASALTATGALTGVLKGNGASAPTAMTGTSNYVTYWSDANTIAATQYLNLSQGGTNKVMTASAGSIAYSDADSLEFSSVGTSGHLLTSGGTGAPTWTDPATLIGANELWSITAGAIHPKNSTTDFLIGATATASAKLSVININSGTPTMEIKGDFKWGGIGSNKIGTLTSNTTQVTMRAPAGAAVGIGANGGNSDIYISATNNVGIGTSSPTALLDIAGAASSSATLAFRGTTDPKINILNGENFGIQTSVGGDAGLTERLTILNNGNVGIGTTSPDTKLHLSSTNGSSILRFELDKTDIQPSDIYGALEFEGQDASANSNGIRGKIDLIGDPNNSGLAGQTALRFFTTTGATTTLSERMRLDSAGNVGIGTTNPVKLLHIAKESNDILRISNAANTNYVDLGGQSGYLNLKPSSASYGTVIRNSASDSYYAVLGANNGYASFSYNNVLGTSSLNINSSGNVGIGTTDPTSRLHTVASGSTSADYTANLLNSTVTSTTDSITKTGLSVLSTGVWTGAGAINRGLYVTATGGTANYAAIFAAGNVGIGTTVPGERLEVRDGRVVLNNSDNNSALLDANTATLDLVNRSGTAGAGPKINFQGWGYGTYSNQIGAAIAAPLISASVNGAAQDLVFLTRNTAADAELSERIRILSTGNVGIGSTAPTQQLDLSGDLRIGGDDLFMATNTANYFLMADGTNYNPTSPADARTGLGIVAGGTGDIWVEKAGDTMTGDLTFNKADGSIIFDTSSATDTDYWLGVQDDAGSDDDDLFQIGDGTTPGTNPFLTINTSGNVGIGTITPSNRLDVRANALGEGISLTSSAASAGKINLNWYDAGYSMPMLEIIGRSDAGYTERVSLRFKKGDTQADFMVLGATFEGHPSLNTKGNFAINIDKDGTGTGAFGIIKGGDGYGRLGTDGVTHFYVGNNGNVGIGTTSPSRTLEVQGETKIFTDAVRFVLFSNDLSAGAANITSESIFNTGTTTYADYNIYTDSAVRMSVGPTGNVGINTTVPTALLDVAGAASTSGTLAFRGATDPKINILNGENFGIQTSVGGDAGLTERLTILNNGNVGIGTTSPTAPLAVSSAAETALVSATGGVGKAGIYGTSGTVAGYGVVGFNNSATGVGVLAQQNSTGYALYATGGKNYFSGNVGIGSLTPSALLDVTGSSKIDSLTLDGNSGTALTISGTTFGADIALQNGETIDNETDGRITLTGNSLTTGTSYFGSGATYYVDNTGVGNLLGLTLTNTGNPFVLSGAATNAIIINNTGTTTDLSMQNGETIDNNTNNTINLGFGAANGILNLTSATEAFITSSVALNIDSATTNALNIGTGANAKTITLGNATGTTALNLNSGTGDITLTSSDLLYFKPTNGVSHFNYASADNRAQFWNSGGTASLIVGFNGSPRIETSASNFHINYDADSHVYFFGGAASGDNRNLYVYGYDTGATAQKHGFFNVDTAGDFNIEAVSGEDINLRTNGGDSLTVDSGTNVGIGSTAPTQKLDVNGRIAMATWTADGDTVAYRDTTTNSIALVTSDRRLKKNIVPLTGSLDIVNQLNTYKYNDLDEADGSKLRLGVMSQEVLPLIPELTYAFTNEGSSETYYGVHYDKLTVLLLGAVKEQQTQINNLADNSISFDEYGALSITGSDESSYQVADAITATPINDRFATFTKTITAIIEAGLTRTRELVVTGRAQIADLSVSNLSINGQTLREYVVSIVQENQATNPVIVEVSPTPAPVATATESAWLAEIFQRESITGEPIVEDLTVTDLLTTQNVDAATVTTEDLGVTGQTQLGSLLVSQNASVAGVMTVNELDANSARIDALEAGMAQFDSVRATTAEFANATVSGTLYAQTIADLDKQIAELLNQPSMIDVITGNIPSPQDDYSTLYQVLGSISSTASQAAQLDQSLADLNLADDDVVLDSSAGFIDRYFKVNGIAYVGDSLGVGNILRVGSKLEITDTYLSFSAGASTPDESPVFFIQPSGKGMLALMGDLMILDEVGQVTINGNLHVAGNVSVEGSLLANVIEPLSPGESIKLNLGSTGTSLEATMAGQIASPSGQFEVLGDAGTPVATVSAQGKASFSSLSLGRDLLERPNVAGAATESGQLTQDATQTTGRAILPAGNKELIIRNPYVRRDSLIYLTPLGSTNNQVLFVKTINAPADESTAQATDERSFTVSLDNTTATDISFTWWIVN